MRSVSAAARVTVCVHGATGYTGAETLRWCLGHPGIQVVGATARSAAGQRLDAVWPAFTGRTDVVISAEPVEADAHFLCLPHGEAAKLAPSLRGKKIDLSGDHRLPPDETLRWYRFPREAPAWLYGLPELGLDRYAGVDAIANPGCFATALALALLPLKGALPATVSAIGLTGSTGSGATPAAGTHHPLRAEALRPYKDKVLTHQHTPEVVQALGGGFRLDFVPISAPLRRGILVTIPLSERCPQATLSHFRAFYEGNPLVRVLSTPPDTLSVMGSPRADLGVVEGAEGQAVVFCAIDNLCRGAGSQAVVNLNLSLGWPMDAGLTHIPPTP